MRILLTVGNRNREDCQMKFLRFADLKDRDVVRNWTTLLRLIKQEGFPPGIRLGAQTRGWPEAEVEAWLESRRIAAPALHTESASQ